MASFISEDNVEQALLQRLQHIHGFNVLDCYTAKPEELNDGSHRADKRDVILPVELKTACLELNPGIPESKIDEAIERVMHRRGAMSPIAANLELYDLIRDGVPVQGVGDDLGDRVQRGPEDAGLVGVQRVGPGGLVSDQDEVGQHRHQDALLVALDDRVGVELPRA